MRRKISKISLNVLLSSSLLNAATPHCDSAKIKQVTDNLIVRLSALKNKAASPQAKSAEYCKEWSDIKLETENLAAELDKVSCERSKMVTKFNSELQLNPLCTKDKQKKVQTANAVDTISSALSFALGINTVVTERKKSSKK